VSLLAIQNAGDLNLTFAVGLLQVGLDISWHEIRYVRRPYHKPTATFVEFEINRHI
jgi:hypothetical protein